MRNEKLNQERYNMTEIKSDQRVLRTNHVYCGDCAFVLKQHVPDNSIDLIVTSPPYLDARDANYKSVKLARYERWFLERSKEFKRVLKPTGSFILNIKESVKNGQRLTYVLDLVIALKECQYWRWVDEFIWHKTNPYPTGTKRRLKDGWEHLFHFAKTARYHCDPDAVLLPSESDYAGDGKRRRNKGAHTVNNGSGMNMSSRFQGDLVRPSNVLRCATSNINQSHSAAFPEELPEFFIKLFCPENGVVLDPFAGSGTTCIAAKKAKRRYIGIDNTDAHVQEIEKRLEEAK
jgi:site-specific DNA-methyltransferase (adenine-specific)